MPNPPEKPKTPAPRRRDRRADAPAAEKPQRGKGGKNRAPAPEEPQRVQRKKAGAPEAEKQSSVRKQTRASRSKAMKRVGRTLRAGSASTVRYTRKAMNLFTAFTQQSEAGVDVEQTPLRRVVRFFSTLSFPMFLLLAAMVVLISMMGFSNTTLTVEKQKISIAGLPKELEGYTIALMSDLHGREYGSAQNVLQRTLASEKYDMAVFVGDMVGASGNPQPFYDLLQALPASKPKFFIAGDSDPEPLLREVRQQEGLKVGEMVLADWVLGAEQRGATYLAHTTPVRVGNINLYLSPTQVLNINLTENLKALDDQVRLERTGVSQGVAGDRNALPLSDWRYHQMRLTQQASGQMLPTDIHIMLSHIPPPEEFMNLSQQLGQEDTIAYLPTVDLVLAGHYCGGVWRLPFLGALYIPNSLYARHGWFPSQADVQGERLLGLSTLYTTAGLGVTDKVFLPDFRLLNPPQISLVTLTAAITGDLRGE